jgi:hypothetical protein
VDGPQGPVQGAILVHKRGGELNFPKEAFNPFRSAELRADHLYRNLALVAEIPGEIDRRHATGADLTLDDIPVAQGGRESLRYIAHEGWNLQYQIDHKGGGLVTPCVRTLLDNNLFLWH